MHLGNSKKPRLLLRHLRSSRRLRPLPMHLRKNKKHSCKRHRLQNKLDYKKRLKLLKN
jgi:hypothetical protein